MKSSFLIIVWHHCNRMVYFFCLQLLFFSCLKDGTDTLILPLPDAAEELDCGCDKKYGSFTDSRDEHTYKTIEIGDQVWMVENLRTTKYPDESHIPLVTNNTEWKELNSNNTDDALVFYGNNKNSIYGALYSYAAAIGDNWEHDLTEGQGVCPTGWHIPSDFDWKNLEISLGMNQYDVDFAGSRGSDEGFMIKSSHGWNNEGNGSNYSGFSALPSGYMHAAFGNIYCVGEECGFWTSTAFDDRNSWYKYVWQEYKVIRRYNARKLTGFCSPLC